MNARDLARTVGGGIVVAACFVTLYLGAVLLVCLSGLVHG